MMRLMLTVVAGSGSRVLIWAYGYIESYQQLAESEPVAVLAPVCVSTKVVHFASAACGPPATGVAVSVKESDAMTPEIV